MDDEMNKNIRAWLWIFLIIVGSNTFTMIFFLEPAARSQELQELNELAWANHTLWRLSILAVPLAITLILVSSLVNSYRQKNKDNPAASTRKKTLLRILCIVVFSYLLMAIYTWNYWFPLI